MEGGLSPQFFEWSWSKTNALCYGRFPDRRNTEVDYFWKAEIGFQGMLLKRNFGEPFGGNWKKIGNFCNFSAIFRDFWDLQICWDIWNLTRQAHFFYTVPFFMKIWLEVLLKIRSFKKKKTCIWVWWRDPPVACCLPTSGGVLYKVQSMHHKLHSCSFSTGGAGTKRSGYLNIKKSPEIIKDELRGFCHLLHLSQWTAGSWQWFCL